MAEDFYERLRTEIVKAAVFDYKKALRKTDRLGSVCEEQEKLERWFLSQWGQLLSGDNGEYIIEKCRKTYKGRKHPNGHPIIPEETQKAVLEDYKSGVKTRNILSKHRISKHQLRTILKRWYK